VLGKIGVRHQTDRQGEFVGRKGGKTGGSRRRLSLQENRGRGSTGKKNPQDSSRKLKRGGLTRKVSMLNYDIRWDDKKGVKGL